MEVKLNSYEEIYKSLKDVFEKAFGKNGKEGNISLNKVRSLISAASGENVYNGTKKNCLIDVPSNLFEEMQETYLERDSEYVSGPIGCTNSFDEELNGITNIALLMYLSSFYTKEYRAELNELGISGNRQKKKQYETTEDYLYKVKNNSIRDLIATIYVSSQTNDEFNNYFSYGIRKDKHGKSSFVIDLPFIEQIGVHFGNEENERIAINEAQIVAKMILKKKLELKQITEEQYKEIYSRITPDSILPQYEGKYYDKINAIPLTYESWEVKNYHKKTNRKLPEEITSRDIEFLRKNCGLKEGEIHYLLVKIGAPKTVLDMFSELYKTDNRKVSNTKNEYRKKLVTPKSAVISALKSTSKEDRDKVNREMNSDKGQNKTGTINKN